MDILSTLAEEAKSRYQGKNPETIQKQAFEQILKGHPFITNLSRKGSLNIIAEVKQASPSKGRIVEDFDPVRIAKTYESAGAQAISVLTEPFRFLGDGLYLSQIHKEVQLPLLRKDFIITPYQILEARILGASAVLLIVALLDKEVLEHFIRLADRLGMDALVEVHDKAELDKALEAGAKIIGVNNRDLRTFEVNIETSLSLKQFIPDSVVSVSESGIKGPEDAKRLKKAGFSAILVGEQLMRSFDRKAAIKELQV